MPNFVFNTSARFLLAVLFFHSIPIEAHQAGPILMTILFSKNGTYEVEAGLDINARLAGVAPGHVQREEWARISALITEQRDQRLNEVERDLRKTFRLKFDGIAVDPAIRFKEVGKNPQAPETPKYIAQFSGRIPGNAREFTLWLSPSIGPAMVAIKQGGNEREDLQLVRGGETSKPFPLTKWEPPRSRWTIAGQYVVLGFEHIVPKGLDHILFVLGLYLLGTSLRALLWQVTAFTVSHSISLGLAMFGMVSLSPRIVEPLIALSIAWVAIENIFVKDLKAWRPLVVFCFGLLHGLGFAGVLTELGLPRGEFVTALASFNIGVELGQLSVILAAFLISGWFRQRNWYRARMAVPASAMIALIALYWTVERIAG